MKCVQYVFGVANYIWGKSCESVCFSTENVLLLRVWHCLNSWNTCQIKSTSVCLSPSEQIHNNWDETASSQLNNLHLFLPYGEMLTKRRVWHSIVMVQVHPHALFSWIYGRKILVCHSRAGKTLKITSHITQPPYPRRRDDPANEEHPSTLSSMAKIISQPVIPHSANSLIQSSKDLLPIFVCLTPLYKSAMENCCYFRRANRMIC